MSVDRSTTFSISCGQQDESDEIQKKITRQDGTSTPSSKTPDGHQLWRDANRTSVVHLRNIQVIVSDGAR